MDTKNVYPLPKYLSILLDLCKTKGKKLLGLIGDNNDMSDENPKDTDKYCTKA